MPVKKAVNDFIVLENKALNASTHLICLKSPIPLPEILPGQFVNVEINNTEDVFLRRPFSIFEVDKEYQSISLLVKILGKGSKKLSEVEKGETVNLIYPLGKGFTISSKNDKIALVGGGSGVAPMLFLSKYAGLDKNNIDIFIGARDSDDHINTDNYRLYANIHLATEDGSIGFKGMITGHPEFKKDMEKFDKIYACGPLPMMKTVAQMAESAGIFCEVSLENLMACGFGACLCCIEPTIKGNVCICTEGPVFNINLLKW